MKVTMRATKLRSAMQDRDQKRTDGQPHRHRVASAWESRASVGWGVLEGRVWGVARANEEQRSAWAPLCKLPTSSPLCRKIREIDA